MIRVMHVVGNLRLGGGQKLAFLVVDGLPVKRFDASVCCLEEGGHYADVLKQKGRKVLELGGRRDYGLRGMVRSSRLLLDMVKVFRAQRPHIVHTHLFGAGVVGRVAAKLCGVPAVITTLHRIFYPKIQPFVEYVLAHWTDAVVVDSKAVAMLVRDRCRIDERKIKVIHNGIEVEEFQDEYSIVQARQILGLPSLVCDSHVPMIGIVAHLLPHKGQKFFVEALRLIRDRGVLAHLLLVGDGPQRTELEIQARVLGLQEAVHVIGYRRELNLVLSALDLLVLPSSWEGFGLILAEAMYKRVPVISTDCGGSREVVSQFETGLLVDFGDVERLASAACLILNNPGLAQQMGERGRNRVMELFVKERMLLQYEELYESVIRRRVGHLCRGIADKQ